MKSKPLVLVVDDEPLNVEFIAGVLEDDYEVKTAYNGNMAIRIVDKFKPDIILLDIFMPIMNGFETIKVLKDTNIPIIFLTSKSDTDSIVTGFKLGAVDYISKPFNYQELLVRVKNHLKIDFLKRDLADQKLFFQEVIDNQPNMILITDGQKPLFVNKTLLKFYHLDSIKGFGCISKTFLEAENTFTSRKENWVEEILKLSPEDRLVKIGTSVKRIFNLSISSYRKNYIVTFNDISRTIIRQISLQNRATHDKLTGALNREFFYSNFKDLSCKNNNTISAVAIVDIDKFKNINDSFGHSTGDSVLKELVEVLNTSSRERDVLIRWGGEEFVIILEVNSDKTLFRTLEKYRKIIEKHSFKSVGNLTCSFGAVVYKEDEKIEDTIKRADKALYKAKESGRNRVVIEI